MVYRLRRRLATAGGSLRKTLDEQFALTPGWTPYVRNLPTKITLMDGSTTRSMYLMQRQAPDGTWQYRKMNEWGEWLRGMPG
jgi:hypothetical protein